MFTGIIEQTGIISSVEINGSNHTFRLKSALATELKVDQSVSHNGVCMTVEEINGDHYRITAIEETIQKTNLAHWKPGTIVNLERCMQMNGRLDGHIVQGHVDTTAVCKKIIEKSGSWEFDFEIEENFAHLIIEKGSICLNGISLTIFNVTKNSFTVAIIPYTYNHTNVNHVKKGDMVNIEFDILGKYISRMIALNNN